MSAIDESVEKMIHHQVVTSKARTDSKVQDFEER